MPKKDVHYQCLLPWFVANTQPIDVIITLFKHVYAYTCATDSLISLAVPPSPLNSLRTAFYRISLSIPSLKASL